MLSLHRSATGQIAMMVLLTAFVFRALIPLGFMPDFTAGGAGMVICSGYEQVTIPQDADENTSSDHGTKQPCGFALNHVFMDAPSVALLHAPAYADAAQPPMDAPAHITSFANHRVRAPPLV